MILTIPYNILKIISVRYFVLPSVVERVTESCTDWKFCQHYSKIPYYSSGAMINDTKGNLNNNNNNSINIFNKFVYF